MAWLILMVAGLLEIGWVVGIRYSESFTRVVPSLLTVGAMALSMYLVAVAARTIPLGTAYAVWVGIGAAGAALAGMALFGEPATVGRLLCLVLIIGGVIGLKLLS